MAFPPFIVRGEGTEAGCHARQVALRPFGDTAARQRGAVPFHAAKVHRHAAGRP